MRYQYDSYMLELTRWCNMECPHCIRGDRERGRMKKETITKILESAPENYINTLMFTGGEPALAVNLMEFALDECIRLGVRVGNFWMATNGLVHTKRFFDILRRWFEYCDEGDISGLRISLDNYHDEINDYPFKEFKYEMEDYGVPCYFEFEGAPDDTANLISGGRAALNYPATRQIEHDVWRDEGFADYEYRIEGTTYFSIKGDLITTCDISYELMDDVEAGFNLGNIHQLTLEQMYDLFFAENPDMIYEK